MIKKILFIVLIIFSFIINHYSRAYSNYINFILVGAVNVFLTAYLLKQNPFGKVGFVLIFLPLFFLLPTTIYDILNNTRFLILNSLIYIITTLLGYFFFKTTFRNKIILLVIYFPIFFVNLYFYENIYNHYFDSFEKVKVNSTFPKIKIFDKSKNEINLPKDKVIVIDLWSNTCSACIKDFPKFQEFSNYYTNEKDVFVLSLNIIEKEVDIINSQKYLANFSFRNYYTDNQIYKKLNFNSVPNYIIIDKKGDIIYFGHLNIKHESNRNYFYKIIENELK